MTSTLRILKRGDQGNQISEVKQEQPTDTVSKTDTVVCEKDLEIKKMRNQIRSLQHANAMLQKSAAQLQHKASMYEKVCLRHQRMSDRWKFVIVWLRLMLSYHSHACVVGNFLRKSFEAMFQTCYMEANDWIANADGGGVDFVLNPVPFQERDKIHMTEKFFQLVSLLQSVQSYNNKKSATGMENLFANYKLMDLSISSIKQCVDNNETIVPHCTCKFAHISGRDVFVMHVYAWMPLSLHTFSVNSLQLKDDGLRSFAFGCDTLSILENMIHRESKYTQQPSQIQQLAFPRDVFLEHSMKSKYLQKILQLISDPLLQMMESGYQLVGTHPAIYIERKDDCPITSTKAPYPCVKLVCGHYVSIMAYKGLVTIQSHESTESIRCPMCRHDLLLMFVRTGETKEVFTLTHVEDEKDKGHVLALHQKYKHISKDALSYMQTN